MHPSCWLYLVMVIGLGILFALWSQAAKAGKPAGDSPSRRVYPRNRKLITPQERQRLFKRLGLKYTQGLVFAKGCEALSDIDKDKLRLYTYFGDLYDDLSAKYGAYVASKYMAPVSIRWVSDSVGYGLFAEQDLPEGAFLMEYAGEVTSSTDDPTWTWVYPKPGGFLPTRDEFLLDAKYYGNEARFVNHGEQYNLELEAVYQGRTWHVVYVAIRAIQKGEELLTDYGGGYWSKRNKVPVQTTAIS